MPNASEGPGPRPWAGALGLRYPVRIGSPHLRQQAGDVATPGQRCDVPDATPATSEPGRYQPRHRLSDLDLDARTATCSICGPTRVKRRSATTAGGAARYRCYASYKATPSQVRSEKKRRKIRQQRQAFPYLDYPPRTQEQRRRSQLAKYGLTPEAFEALAVQQERRCAICRRARPLCVDHDHQTGRVRGLLCRSCNQALGVFGDTRDGIMAALQYLS